MNRYTLHRKTTPQHINRYNEVLARLKLPVYCACMNSRTNPRQLVIRCDTATGLTQVGWESDLPMGRFEHLALICEVTDNSLPDSDSEFYPAYQTALRRARQANTRLLEQQINDNRAKGWYFVSFDLSNQGDTLECDNVGNFAAAAMQLHYQLTHNSKQVWAVIQDEKVVHVRSRLPPKPLDELSYQVWYHQQRHQLENMEGILLQGILLICESGLWFDASG